MQVPVSMKSTPEIAKGISASRPLKISGLGSPEVLRTRITSEDEKGEEG